MTPEEAERLEGWRKNMKTQAELSSEEMGRTIVKQHNEIVKLKDHLEQGDVIMKELIKQDDLRKEELRVAHEANKYLIDRCKMLEEANERANKLIEDEANKRAKIEGDRKL